MQGQLGRRFAREGEGVTRLVLGDLPVQRVVGGDQAEHHVGAALEVIEEDRVEGADTGAQVGVAADPLGPVEAVHEVVHVAEADRGVAAVELLQAADPGQTVRDILSRTRARAGASQRVRDQKVEVTAQVVREALALRVRQVGDAGRQRHQRIHVVRGQGRGDAQLEQRARLFAPGRERAAAPGVVIEAAIGPD